MKLRARRTSSRASTGAFANAGSWPVGSRSAGWELCRIESYRAGRQLISNHGGSGRIGIHDATKKRRSSLLRCQHVLSSVRKAGLKGSLTPCPQLGAAVSPVSIGFAGAARLTLRLLPDFDLRHFIDVDGADKQTSI